MIEEILSVAKALWGYKDLFDKAKREKRDRIANYFEQISRCLAETSTMLKDNQYPHGACGEMLGYADMLPETVGGIISKEKAQDLANQLHSMHELEKLYSQLHDAPDKDEQLGRLLEASGILQALANSLRAV